MSSALDSILKSESIMCKETDNRNVITLKQLQLKSKDADAGTNDILVLVMGGFYML